MKPDISGTTLIGFFGTIICAMTGKSDFVKLQIMLGELAVALDAYTTAWGVAQIGSRSEKQIEKVLKAELQHGFKELCKNLNVLHEGNRAVLLASAFHLSKETRTKMVLLTPAKVTVTPTKNEGEFLILFKRQKGTQGANVDYTVEENTGKSAVWLTESCDNNSCLIGGFTPGQKVTFRVCVTGPHGQKQVSASITRTANYAS